VRGRRHGGERERRRDGERVRDRWDAMRERKEGRKEGMKEGRKEHTCEYIAILKHECCPTITICNPQHFRRTVLYCTVLY
jgi:hypothetical protein